jgi:hypothetical protein
MAPRNDDLEKEWRGDVRKQLQDHESRLRVVETSNAVTATKLGGIVAIGVGLIEVAKHFLLK